MEMSLLPPNFGSLNDTCENFNLRNCNNSVKEYLT